MARRTRKPRQPTGDYEVGYCKPPIETRFPNQVSNRTGRPKSSKSFPELLEEILDSTLEMRGRTGRVSKVKVKRAMATKQVETALKGDVRTFLAIAKLLDRTAYARDRDAAAPAETSDAADEAIIASFLARRLAPPDGEEGS